MGQIRTFRLLVTAPYKGVGAEQLLKGVFDDSKGTIHIPDLVVLVGCLCRTASVVDLQPLCLP
jgi:hypothetical protein